MPRLFGTDGVRGVANRDLTPDLGLALGRAAGFVLAPGGGRVVIGRDTRLSGPMLEAALSAGLCSAGCEVLVGGVLPTPAVAFLTIAEGANAGAVISASHNPVPDNGIKFFSPEGVKLAEGLEDTIERAMTSPATDLPVGASVGHAEPLRGGADRYMSHLLGSIHSSLQGLDIVLDCAYGAAYSLAPRVFRAAGAEVKTLHDEPDGSRINVRCGSTSLALLSRAVVEEGAHFGLAFDGDADRVLAVDERGDPVDGDRIIALSALRLLEQGKLHNNVVVSTVMANLGFRRALEARGIEVLSAPVGDRNVAHEMARSGAVLGGEQSGHVIWALHSSTGDGILTGLQTAAAVAAAGEPLSKLTALYSSFPQVLINVEVRSREALSGAEGLWSEVQAAEASLGDDGRVLLRASGTEPVVRVMVEATDASLAQRTAESVADAVRRHLA
ncbi:MAG: phosphoglucosamine mutase [Actinobacteria bacterium]|nr:phosphoglucosamine mutase [Actinomycetota bacterium]